MPNASPGEGGVVALNSFRNEKAVQTHPLDQKTPCVLKRKLRVPKGKSTFLETRVSYHAHGDWPLRILADKEVLHDQLVSFGSVKEQWLEVKIDLTKYVGKEIQLTLENRPNSRAWEFAFWSCVKIAQD